MKPCRIIVVRHGQSTSNRDEIISGYDDDPELTDEGRNQAQRTREKLSHIAFDEVYSSDLQRAVETAGIIHGQSVHETRRLTGFRERKFGAIDGKPNSRLDELRRDPAFTNMSHEERWTHRFEEDMESDNDVASRFEKTLIEVACQHMGQTILVAAHGGTLRILLIHLGYATAQELPYGSIDNAAYVELLYNSEAFSFGEVGGIHKS